MVGACALHGCRVGKRGERLVELPKSLELRAFLLELRLSRAQGLELAPGAACEPHLAHELGAADRAPALRRRWGPAKTRQRFLDVLECRASMSDVSLLPLRGSHATQWGLCVSRTKVDDAEILQRVHHGVEEGTGSQHPHLLHRYDHGSVVPWRAAARDASQRASLSIVCGCTCS